MAMFVNIRAQLWPSLATVLQVIALYFGATQRVSIQRNAWQCDVMQFKAHHRDVTYYFAERCSHM